MKRNTQKIVIEAEVPKSLTEVGVDAVDAAIKAATPYLEQAREVGVDAVDAAIRAATPYVDQAREAGAAKVAGAQNRMAPLTASAQAKLGPLAQQAKERGQQAQEILTEYAHEAQVRLAPVAAEAQARLAPVAHEAKVRGIAGARGTLETLAPRVEGALLAVGPLAEEAATRIKEDVVPRAEKLLDKASDAVTGVAEETAATAKKMSRKQAKAAAKKFAKAEAELSKAEAKLARRESKRGGGFWKVLLILTGVVGIGFVIAKKLGSPKEDAWQNYQPTPPAPAPTAPAPAETAAAEAAAEPTAPDVTDGEMDEETAEAEAEMIGEGGGITEADLAVSTDTATSYGPDSFVGTEPPEGFTIKGNPRSMKYHLPGSDSYNRTVTDVWFASEEAAAEAGFTKATR
ncbi:hypothetical protein [Raineyella sp.]|uniref:Uncharacterized protein n=1 Tax=bioreactor metagenome TaxID=1076179 RepID=A0A645A1G2_9ZZZZ|nr:hypothetical protein [Raineyella sp.]MEA5155203.1 hypothetical protein [Raineyella sp.]